MAAVSNDPLTVLNWLLNHNAVWLIAFGIAAAAWVVKRVRTWLGASPQTVSALRSWIAEVQATAEAAQQAQRAPAARRQPRAQAPPPVPAAAGARAASRHESERPMHAAPDEPAAAFGSPARALIGAFGDPASARTAVVLAEILGPPVALR